MTTVLRYELEAIEGFHATASLAELIGVTLEPMLWSYTQCSQAFSEGGFVLVDARTWLPDLMDETDENLESAFRCLRSHFESRDETFLALFEFAALSASCKALAAMTSTLTDFAQRARLRTNLWSAFVETMSAESTDGERLQREFNRLNKVVERELSYDLGTEG